MDFRIKWYLYRVNGESKEEAVKKLAKMIKDHPQDFFRLEDASLYDGRRSLWSMLFSG